MAEALLDHPDAQSGHIALERLGVRVHPGCVLPWVITVRPGHSGLSAALQPGASACRTPLAIDRRVCRKQIFRNARALDAVVAERCITLKREIIKTTTAFHLVTKIDH